MPGEVFMVSPELITKDDVIIVGFLAPYTSAALQVSAVELEPEKHRVKISGTIIQSSGTNAHRLPKGMITLHFNSESMVATYTQKESI